MNILQRSLDHVFEYEGGLVDHPNDPGGITNLGISIKFAGSIHLDLDRDGRTTAADIRAIDKAEATNIYLKWFWIPARCPELPDPIALAQLDAAVNLGVGRAVRMLQKGLRFGLQDTKIAVDGAFGPQTMAAVDRVRTANDPAVLDRTLREMLARRGEWYACLDELDDDFGLGWMRRLMHCAQRANRLLVAPPA